MINRHFKKDFQNEIIYMYVYYYEKKVSYIFISIRADATFSNNHKLFKSHKYPCKILYKLIRGCVITSGSPSLELKDSLSSILLYLLFLLLLVSSLDLVLLFYFDVLTRLFFHTFPLLILSLLILVHPIVSYLLHIYLFDLILQCSNLTFPPMFLPSSLPFHPIQNSSFFNLFHFEK